MGTAAPATVGLKPVRAARAPGGSYASSATAMLAPAAMAACWQEIKPSRVVVAAVCIKFAAATVLGSVLVEATLAAVAKTRLSVSET